MSVHLGFQEYNLDHSKLLQEDRVELKKGKGEEVLVYTVESRHRGGESQGQRK